MSLGFQIEGSSRRKNAKKLARGMDSALIIQTKRLSAPQQRDNETAYLK